MTNRPPQRSTQVQPEKPAPAVPPAAEGPPPPAPPRLHWGWHLALFLWATSFIFLLLYDVLSGIFRVIRWLF